MFKAEREPGQRSSYSQRETSRVVAFSAEQSHRPITVYLEKRVASIMERRHSEEREVLKREHLIVVANDPETKKRANSPYLLKTPGQNHVADVRVVAGGFLCLPKYRRLEFSDLDDGFDLLIPPGKRRLWERRGHVDWKVYSKARKVTELIFPKVRGGIEDAIRYCGHIIGSREFGQMTDVVEKVSRLTVEAMRRKELKEEDLKLIAQSTAMFLIGSGLTDAKLSEKKKIADKLLAAAGFFSEEGKKNLLGVMMKLFSARLEAQKRLEGIVPAARTKYGANAEALRFVRERTRRLISDMSDKRIQLLLDNFTLFDDKKRPILSPVQKNEQVRTITANIASWSYNLRENVNVRPYLSPATIVAIRLGGEINGKDRERWELILGDEGLKQASSERIIPLLRSGREEDYKKAWQLLVDSQALLRKVLEEHKDIYLEKS